MSDDMRAVMNTDRELWREREGDAYADSMFVTACGSIGINVGGHVIVKPLRDWFSLAAVMAEMIADSDDVDAGKLPRISAATLTRARQLT
jgi:hypothetical protein